MKSYHRQAHWTFRELLVLTQRRHQYSFFNEKIAWFCAGGFVGQLICAKKRCTGSSAAVPTVQSFAGPTTARPAFLVFFWSLIANVPLLDCHCTVVRGSRFWRRWLFWCKLVWQTGSVSLLGSFLESWVLSRSFWRLSLPWLSLQCLLWLFWCKLVWQKQTSSMSLAWVQGLWWAEWKRIGGDGEKQQLWCIIRIWKYYL